ncbi:hypothetical protein SAMN04488026_11138 [Aliiruegeria lutimaris]|uniref:Uncharacterized protein n=1 Tax=Aliiruegeria lutimaris TaxID=571298 RepID=A0A1G9MRS4_9RHOB|nr:hypothetical protein SAMN04488026_11138 [Aliiruegeria lutimaris]
MDASARRFPDHVDEIGQLRLRDPEFAEICRDLEVLMGLLPCAADDPTLPDIRDSLSGLEKEIRSYLGRSANRQATAPPREPGQPQGSET